MTTAQKIGVVVGWIVLSVIAIWTIHQFFHIIGALIALIVVAAIGWFVWSKLKTAPKL